MIAAVALHLVVIFAALAVIARELAKECFHLRSAYAGLRTTRPWQGPVIVRPSVTRARAADAGATPPSKGAMPLASTRFPHHVAVELSTGFRVYRLAPGSTWQTREEVEVHGTLVGWSDGYCGTSLPKGMTTADLALLPRATRAPAPAPIAVCAVAWSALPEPARAAVRYHADTTKGPGVMRLGALSPSTRRIVEGLLVEGGLAVVERTAEHDLWGTP